MRTPSLFFAPLLLLAACAAPTDVKLVATEAGTPHAYDLHGNSLMALQTEADQRCPKGYDVVHEWQREAVSDSPNSPGQWLRKATGPWLGGVPSDNAQLMVQCKA